VDDDLSAMSERRFNEAEVAAIFERATEAQQQTGQRQLPSGEGMTLAQLQEIGREVGISAELVASAAHSIDRVGSPTSRSFLGLPVGVGRTVELDRKLSEEEWERLVVDLRETFDARGSVRRDGSLRQWTNGNLQALLEPTPTGHRVRMRTTNGNALSWMTVGLGMGGIGAAVMTAAALGINDASMAAMGVLAAMGVGMFGVGAMQLPRWAQERRRQMEEIAARLTSGTPEP
jgi:hypothetical protein